MKILDILRKLGIVRFGSVGGTYKSYQDRPDELMFDNVYDKKKDLVDFGKNKSNGQAEKQSSQGSITVFLLLLVFSFLFLLFFGLMIKFTFWFYVAFFVWLAFFFIVFRYKNGLTNLKTIIWFFIIYLFLLLVFTFIAIPSKNPSTEKEAINKGQATTNNESDCKSLATKYDGKIFKITASENLKGQIGLRVNPENCQYKIVWQTLFSSPSLIKNQDTNAVSDFVYVANVVFDKESEHPADGSISPVFANFDQLPSDPFSAQVPFKYYSTDDIISGKTKHAPTNTFRHAMEQTGTLSQSTIDEILKVKKIEIFDGAPFYKDYQLDQDGAVKSGRVVASFPITVSE